MRKFFLTVPILFLVSCSSVQLLSTDAETSKDILRSSNTRPAIIMLKDHSVLDAYRVEFGNDSTAWYSPSRKFRSSRSTTDIYSISVPDPAIWSDAAIGACGGALVGVTIGMMVAIGSAVQIFPDRSQPPPPTMAEFVLTGAAIGGIIGAIVGNSHRILYIE